MRSNLPAETFESFYLVVDGEVLQKSRGFLRMAGCLRGPWPWLRAPAILPAA